MNKSHIIDGVRSPIGVKNGQIVGLRPDDLAAQVVKSLLKRNLSLKIFCLIKLFILELL